MDITEVKLALEKKFNLPLEQGAKRHIVFWFDEEQSFSNLLNDIVPENVTLHLLQDNYFLTKHLIEEKNSVENLLVYSPAPRPKKEDDWLYDIYKYSMEFSADTITLIMNELGLDRGDIRGFIKANRKFFDSQERFDRLMEMCTPEWSVEDMQIGMMAVACKLRQPNFEYVLRALFTSGLDEEENKLWQTLIKWPGKETFYRLAEKYYGYVRENPSLKTLVMTLMISDLSLTSTMGLPPTWEQYRTPSRNNCRIFIDHWINHGSDYQDYETLSASIAADLNLKDFLRDQSVETYSECETFEDMDRHIIVYLANSLSEGLQDFEKYLNLISARKSRHWYEKHQYIYGALEAAVRMLVLRNQYPSGFPSGSPGELVLTYAEEYCKFDRLYRDFYFNADLVDDDILRKRLIPEVIEPLYKNWYLEKLSDAWFQPMQSLADAGWSIQQIDSQKDFYRKFVRPVIDSTAKDKIFVIISDALRYEAGLELESMLNRETRGSTTITPVLGVIPSITPLGMAALLPRQSIELKPDGRVFLDGIDSSGLEGRNKILKEASSESLAYPLNELMAMSKDESRDVIKDARVIYLYHDTIDAMGDKARTEKKTFQAVRDCLDELFRYVKKIVNSLNGTRIFITSDHGFLYNREPLAESDKLESLSFKDDLILNGRRHAISTVDLKIDGTQRVDMEFLLAQPSGALATIPNGNIRFSCKGAGNLFVHGGGSLQEVVVPVIQFHNIRKDSKRDTATRRPVKVELTTPTRKITNNRFTLVFFQKDKVEGKLKPVTLKILFMDDETATQISDEKTIIADRMAEDPRERVFKLSFTLKGQTFDKSKQYYMKMMDSETGVEVASLPFQISIAIANDFDDFL
jgi:uncharacterized protein (TIGR02687 family)